MHALGWLCVALLRVNHLKRLGIPAKWLCLLELYSLLDESLADEFGLYEKFCLGQERKWLTSRFV